MLLQSFIQQIWLWTWEHPWILVLVGILIGFLFSTIFLAARSKAINRYIRLVRTSTIEEFESRIFGVRVLCRKVFPSTRNLNALNVPPPALNSGNASNSTAQILISQPNEQIYYLPNKAGIATGLAFPPFVKIVHGNPPILEMTQILPVDIIPAPANGVWIPGRVGSNNISLTMEGLRTKKFWKGSRNFYILDFFEKNDCLGFIQPIEKKSQPIPVLAPASGYILQFGALERTPIVAGASVMLVAKLETHRILSENVGTFFDSVDSKLYAELGKTVRAGEILGVIKYLGKLNPLVHKVIAPCDLILLRSFAHAQNPEDGAPVGFNSKLFTFQAL
ncbi:MAG: hypothetical protein WCT08_01685 [Patescibacteria group bacterium]